MPRGLGYNVRLLCLVLRSLKGLHVNVCTSSVSQATCSTVDARGPQQSCPASSSKLPVTLHGGRLKESDGLRSRFLKDISASPAG